MENRRYDYWPMIERKELKWPNNARVALWVCPNIEYKPISVSANRTAPDIAAYSLVDYGLRVGVFRLMEVLDKHGIRASVLLNSDVCERHPIIIDEGNKRAWEWLGHGRTNNLRMTSYSADEERVVIRTVKETITAAIGKPPKGWLGPALAETFNTPDHLAAEGFEYLCDWACDDQPVPIRVNEGRMVLMPYQQGINDFSVFMNSNHTPTEYLQMVCDQFDTLYQEGERSGRVMAIPLHTYLIGLPFRIKYLDKALEYILSHEGVWRATGWEIADWYFRHYYQDPGRPHLSS